VSPLNLAIAQEPDGRVMMHRADCPYLRALAEQGFPVLTMLDCQGDPDPELPRHDCLIKH